MNISKSYEVRNFRLLPGKLTEDIPVFVKEHGGKIYIDRTFRTGAKFVVEFPVIHYSPDLAQTCNSTVSPSANR